MAESDTGTVHVSRTTVELVGKFERRPRRTRPRTALLTITRTLGIRGVLYVDPALAADMSPLYEGSCAPASTARRDDAAPGDARRPERASISHSASSPFAITLFLSRRFSRVNSATISLSALASRRRSLTLSDVAARAVSPEPPLPRFEKLHRPAIIEVLNDPQPWRKPSFGLPLEKSLRYQ
jgi:hypothetical protein